MKKGAKPTSKVVPNNIDERLVNGIKIPYGKFNLRKLPVIFRTLLICSLILIPIDFFRGGQFIVNGPLVFAWILHSCILSPLIAGIILGVFKYEVNEFGVKCFNIKGGTWFIEWGNFESIEKKKFLGIEYISVKPSDNYDTFAISGLMANYDLFKALCFHINKGNHKLIEHL